MKLHLPLSLLIYVCALYQASAGVGDTGSVWDPNWGAAGLSGAPDAAAPEYQAHITTAGVTALVQPAGEPAPYDFGPYTAITLVGAGNAAAQIVGGASATDAATTGAVALSSWIAAEEGQYALLVGGSYADNWNSGVPFHFTGDSHILVNGATVANVMGGNYKDGQSAQFTGDSYISVLQGNVTGAIVGAGVVAHNRSVSFVGDTHVFVYVPLADNGGPALHSVPTNMVMGGFAWGTNTWKTQTLTGSTHVTVDLSAYNGNGTTFAKHIVGGGFSGASGNSQLITGDTHVSVNLGTVTAADTVRVVGGHWVNAGGGRVEGTANLSLSGGSFSDWIVGGAWTDVSNTNTYLGAVEVALSGGSTSGNVLGGTYMAAGVGSAEVGTINMQISDTATVQGTLYGGCYINGTGADSFSVSVGDVQIVLTGGTLGTVVGGSYVARNHADAVVQQGHISLSLQGGALSGNLYAAGQQEGASSLQTLSTTVEIASEVDLAAGITISGGYAGTAPSATVQGERSLVLSSAAAYTDTADVSFADFDCIEVAAGGSATLGSLQGNDSLTKRGAGYLQIAGSTGLTELVLQGGSLSLTEALAGAAVQSLQMEAGTQLLGITGTLSAGSVGQTDLLLTVDESNIGADAAATPMLSGSNVTLSITGAQNAQIDLSADAVVSVLESHRDAGATSWITLTDGLLEWVQEADAAITPTLSAYGIRVSGTNGGSLLLSGQAQGVYFVSSNPAATDPHTITTYPTLGMYQGVVIEGGETLTLQLPGDTAASARAVVRNLVGGTESALLLQNSSGSGVAQVELQQNADTVMAGSITAGDGTQVLKTGSGTLTVQGAFTAPSVEIAGGELQYNGSGNMLEYIMGQGSLTLGSDSATSFLLHTDEPQPILSLARLVIQSGASLTLEAVGTEYLSPGEYVLGELDELAAGDYQLTLSGTPFFRTDTSRSFLLQEDGRLYLFLVETGGNPLADVATSANAGAGAELLWNGAPAAGADVQSVYNEVMQWLHEGNTAAINQAMAAVAGASYSALGMALQQDVQQRLYAMRNRAVQLSLPDCYEYDIPLLQAWVQAEGARTELRRQGTAAGYTLSSWGGTLGMDAAVSDSWTLGVALTALYGEFQSRAADVLRGDVDRYALSLVGHYDHCGWNHSVIVAGTWAEADLHRFVPFGNGYSTAGRTHGYGLGVMYEVGYRFTTAEQPLNYVQPFAYALYSYSSLRGLTETGSDAALHVGSQVQQACVLGLGVRGQTAIAESSADRTATLHGRAVLNAHAGDRRGEASVSWAEGGSAGASVISATAGVLGVELGAGLNIPVGVGSGELYMDASAELRAHSVEIFGNIGYRCRF